MTVWFLVPEGYADRPSGGNVYARRLLGAELGLAAVEVSRGVPPVVPDDDLLLVDSVVSSWWARALPADRTVPLVHMLFGTLGETELLEAAPAVVTTSAWMRGKLATEVGLDPARLHVAEPGVDVAGAVPGSWSGGELLCVGSVVPAKGQDVLLSALARLRDLDWRCTLVGSLDLEPDYVERLQKYAANAGIADRVGVTGAQSHDEVRAAYAGADVLVHPSRGESYGMVVTEALAHGLPVIAGAVGGVPEAVGRAADGSVPGVLVEPNDPVALAGALRHWLTHSEHRRRLRAAAVSRRETLTGWEQTCARVAVALEAAT